jgi:hypothetical protein
MDSPKTLANIGYTKHRGGKIKKKQHKNKNRTTQHRKPNMMNNRTAQIPRDDLSGSHMVSSLTWMQRLMKWK